MATCLDMLPTCKAECCGPCPIPERTWRDRQADVQRQPIIDQPDGRGFVHVVAEDSNCPFKRTDNFRCAIYPKPGEPDPRSEGCRIFGNETHLMLTCRYLDANGRTRTRAERRALSVVLLQSVDRTLRRIRGGSR